jgi:hypothetical protein
VNLPVATTSFPEEVFHAQQSLAREDFPRLSSFHELNLGVHLATCGYAEPFANELRAAFE